MLLALAAVASILFTNNAVGSKPMLLLCGFLGRCYLEVVSASSVVLSETPSFPAGEHAWNASNQQRVCVEHPESQAVVVLSKHMSFKERMGCLKSLSCR